ncbi:MAG: hypothetical protein RJQ10_05660 [Haliea sp.]|uniref:hypothetical protein n=1 Tax=Haliea sp. TaxID=1932666 RepID=UPI0032EE5D1A
MNTRDWFWQLDHLLARVAGMLGVRISRDRPVDCIDSGMHPVAAYYAANGRPVAFDAPLERLRGLGANAFACHVESNHPYVLALLDYRSGLYSEYSGSVLETFYRCCQPRTASEHLGVDCLPEVSVLKELPPEMAVLPWQKETPDEWWRIVRRSVVKDQKRIAEGGVVSEADWHFFGPMSPAAGRREWRRLVDLYHAMKTQGYRRSPRLEGDVTGQLLLDDRDSSCWAFCVLGGGQHRSAVAGAIGHRSIPVRLAANRTPIVVRSHVDYWPQVQSGLFTISSALEVFDRIVAGRQPFPWNGRRNVAGPENADAVV